MNLDKLTTVADLATALAHAEIHLPRSQPPHVVEPFDFMMFTQAWSDTSLGLGGIAGQAFTTSTVIVCWRLRGEDAVVYVGGRYAYPVHQDDPRREQFWHNLRVDRPVTGAYDWIRECKHRLRKNSNVCDFCGRGQPLP